MMRATWWRSGHLKGGGVAYFFWFNFLEPSGHPSKFACFAFLLLFVSPIDVYE